jgi:hypothetical protein
MKIPTANKKEKYREFIFFEKWQLNLRGKIIFLKLISCKFEDGNGGWKESLR